MTNQLDLDAIEQRAKDYWLGNDDECAADAKVFVDQDIPALVAEVRRLRAENKILQMDLARTRSLFDGRGEVLRRFWEESGPLASALESPHEVVRRLRDELERVAYGRDELREKLRLQHVVPVWPEEIG